MKKTLIRRSVKMGVMSYLLWVQCWTGFRVGAGLALGDVSYALATKSSQIPYSPSEHDVSETMSSLNFATRVRGVELGHAKKQVDTGEIQKMKAMVEKARQES